MKKIIFGISLLGLTTISYSQQIPQYSQYLRNQFMVNPAAAGVYNFTDITLSGRSQWTGFDNAPMTSYMSICAPISKNARIRYNPGIRTGSGLVQNPEIPTGKLKHAIGGQMLVDQYGAFRKIQFAGTYALHIPLSEKVMMSFGARVGLSNNSFIQSRAIVLDPTLDKTYINYTMNQSNTNILDLGTGLYIYSKRLFFGVAADQLTKNMVNFGSGTASFDPQIYLNAMGGIKLKVNENFTVTPAFIVKYMSPAPVSIEGTLQFEYKEAMWAGISYRNTDAIIAMIGININKKLKFGYSYDYSVSRFNKYSSGGHELVLGIMIGRN
ncbi:MAG: type IX secretion system membrane protein PorP/SprF [Flavobacteriia bacterium]|nr:type IX secretion system membrane protein PorP/SprF [Flavobacteriia bacterium]